MNPAPAPKPLFRDPIFDGAADPILIYHRGEAKWFLLYTNRRANVPDLPGVSWVHGSPIGLASSDDGGATWNYRGTANIPVGTEESSFWAPDVVFHEGKYHMFLSLVPEMHTDWSGTREILHLTGENLFDWQFESQLKLSSDRVIDAGVMPMPNGTWRLWYNDERDGKSIYMAESADLFNWHDRGKVVGGRGCEGPKVFFWQDFYWMIVDRWDGLGVFRSLDADSWEEGPHHLLQQGGNGADDGGTGHHADVVVNENRAFLFYFTHPGRAAGAPPESPEARRSSIQVAELRLENDWLQTDRDAATFLNLQPPRV